MEELKAILIPSKYIGRCVEQVERFLKNDVDPLLADGDHTMKVELSVSNKRIGKHAPSRFPKFILAAAVRRNGAVL